MAEIYSEGLTELILDLEAVAGIPDEVKDKMLNAKADIIADAQRAQIMGLGIVRTGKLLESIRKGKPKTQKGARVIYVNATGNRAKAVKDRKTRQPALKKTRNVEIAFLQEYGTKRQKARPFIKRANEAAADRAAAAAAAVYDRWLKSKNL